MGNEIGIVLFMSVAAFLWSASTYAIGFKEGERQGYQKGRAISRHASSRIDS
jgi:hypothetical protein